VLLNYACPPELLAPLVPAGTVLDAWQGRTLVSVVGFLFADTRLGGWAVPFHRTFEEVNLTGALSELYGDAFGRVLRARPHSAFVAVGSDVAVHRGRRLERLRGE
jgi:uncharacterized protein YqjF (DUF2071 family)